MSYLSKNAVMHESVALEDPVRLYGTVRIKEECSVGRFTFLNDGTTLHLGTRIGRFCSVGKNVEIGTYEHPLDRLSTSPVSYNMAVHFPDHLDRLPLPQVLPERPEGTVVGHDVWIGTNALIRRGVTIGHGAVIAAGAFVKADVAPYQIVGGLPARPIRSRFAPDIVERLLRHAWWDLPDERIARIPFGTIDDALAALDGSTAPEPEGPDEPDTTVADLKRLVASIPGDRGKAGGIPRDEFLDLVRGKLLDRNAPEAVAALLERRAARLYTGYDLDDPAQVRLLNVKIGHIADLAERKDAYDEDGKLSLKAARAIMKVMRGPM